MPLLPFSLDEYRPHYHRRYPRWDQPYLVTPDFLSDMMSLNLPNRDYYRPWRQLAVAARDVGSSITSDKDKFQINLDVQHFKPEEITVKTVDGFIVVEGKHEEKQDDHGFISRQFKRRYALPENTTPESVESKLSSDGVLSVIAPKKVPEALRGERNVSITRTGPVRKEIKDQSEGTNEKEKEKENEEKK